MSSHERKVKIGEVPVGSTLARDLIDGQGRLVLQQDTVLTPTHIGRLQQHGIREMYVCDPQSMPGTLSPYTWQSYRRTLTTVKGMFRHAEAEQRVDVDQIAQSLVELSKSCKY